MDEGSGRIGARKRSGEGNWPIHGEAHDVSIGKEKDRRRAKSEVGEAEGREEQSRVDNRGRMKDREWRGRSSHTLLTFTYK